MYTCINCALRPKNNGLVIIYFDLAISHLHVAYQLDDPNKVNSVIRPNHGAQMKHPTYI